MVEGIKRKIQVVVGVISVMGSLYLFMSLVTHNLRDPVLFLRATDPPEPIRNLGGIIGAHMSGWMIVLLGIAAFLIPLLLFAFGVKRMLGKEGHRIYLFGSILFIVSCSLVFSLLSYTFDITIAQFPDGIGGLFGRGVESLAKALVSLPGAYMFSLAMFFSSVVLISPVSVTSLAFKKKPKAGRERQIIDEPSPVEEEERKDSDLLVTQEEHKEIIREHQAVKPKRKGGYELPSLDLLNASSTPSVKRSNDELLEESKLIEDKLGEFGVEGKVTKASPGPVVTTFEFEPASGVKINRVVSLSDDLALAMKAQSIRMSTIPGTSSIGIEIPNMKRESVVLREILSSDKFQKSKSILTLGLGKDISGKPVVTDLLKMPHLLVAGATGSGKSVSINTMVMSMLYKATPAEVKMLMIDPKLLELSAYEEIPHLISPVITNPKEAAEALKKMVIEMERRYRVLAERAARDIEKFNLKAQDEEKLPYIVVIIDELADLMFTAASDVEDSIARLAQMGRASGIHLILATQRPSVDVITGIIKANFPARISFQVSSKVDSRTILDSHGAETLLGRGDMLLLLPGARITRIHGALITEDETRRVTEFIQSQERPDYSLLENIQDLIETEADRSGERDELYMKAVEFGESTGEVSISSIQRRLKIGYNRAARIMELLEEDGRVGPHRGAGKPREFLRRRR
jgi:S-DNA-T family DNA segregation ATPase FtsK/SpoIIIE